MALAEKALPTGVQPKKFPYSNPPFRILAEADKVRRVIVGTTKKKIQS